MKTLKKLKMAIGIVLLLSTSTSFGQGWQRSFGCTHATSSEECYSILQATDGDYVMLGYTNSCGGGDMFLLKIGSDGGPFKWGVSYGVPVYNDQTSNTAGKMSGAMAQATDGGYIMAGFYPATFSSAPGQEMYLLKLSKTDALGWQKTYGNSVDLDGTGNYPTDAAMGVRTTTDGGTIMVGYGEGGTAGSNDFDHEIELVKSSSTGALSWTLMFGTSGTGNENNGADVEQTTDGGYVVVGSTSAGAGDIYLAKAPFDQSTLTVSWGRRIGTAGGWEEGYVVHQATDGGYVILSGGTNAATLSKVTNAGTVVSWSKNYGNSCGTAIVGNDMIKTSDGGYAITGSTTTGGTEDIILIKINSIGTIQWGMRYGGTSDDEGWSLKQTSDGGYVIGGWSNVSGYGHQMYIVKTDGSGSTGSNETSITACLTTANAGFVNNAETPNHKTTVPSSGLTTTPHTFTTTQIKGFGPNNAVLPVKLISFVGRYQDKKTYLDWAIASEMNNDYFTIERQIDHNSGIWDNAGRINAMKNSSTVHNYSFIDEELEYMIPKPSTVYYRLKQTDFNGAYEYFPEIAITTISEDGIVIHTNVTNEQLMVSFPENVEEKSCSVKIYDISGRICFGSNFIPNKYKKDMWIDASGYTLGIYIISVTSVNGFSAQKKFIKME